MVGLLRITFCLPTMASNALAASVRPLHILCPSSAAMMFQSISLNRCRSFANDLHRLSEIDWNIIAADEGHKMCNGRTDAARAFEAIVGRQKVIRNSPTIAVIDGGPVQISTRGRSRPKPTRQV